MLKKTGGSMNDYEYVLLKLLKAQLTGNNQVTASEMCSKTMAQMTDAAWWKIIKLAENHSVLSIIAENEIFISHCNSAQKKAVLEKSSKVVMKNYRLLWLGSKYQKMLEEQGICSVILKGFAAAVYYEVPEVRKSGDIDILIVDAAKMDSAVDILKTAGLKYEAGQHSSHHAALVNARGITVELHKTLAEHFDNQHTDIVLNNIVKQYRNHIKRTEFLGNTLMIPSDAYNAFSLTVHMLQHYLRAGFGLKLLCDWVVFWNRDIDALEKEQFMRLVKELKITGFVNVITGVCVKYLGLSRNRASFMQSEREDRSLLYRFMMDILDAEEFGYCDQNRMVVLRDASIISYLREFHHQMKINNLKASRYVFLWPILWIKTMLVFLQNNKRIRHTSTLNILRNASERSGIMNKIKLFQL